MGGRSCPFPVARSMRTPAGSTSPSPNAFARSPRLGGRSHRRDGGGRLMLCRPPGQVTLAWRVPPSLGGAWAARCRLRAGQSMIFSSGAGPRLRATSLPPPPGVAKVVTPQVFKLRH
jgi:hypothetical protein